MLTGDLVRVKIAKQRVAPIYIDREAARWLEAAESLLLLFREGIGIAGWPRSSRIAPSSRL
jgi:predicted nuclease of restriction endonuclease-like RecB superfamily